MFNFELLPLSAVDAYNHTDSEFLKSENNQNRDAGSTASTAILVGDRLLVANVGDSRAVICRGGNGETHNSCITFATSRILFIFSTCDAFYEIATTSLLLFFFLFKLAIAKNSKQNFQFIVIRHCLKK
jgi:hypothetical protein